MNILSIFDYSNRSVEYLTNASVKQMILLEASEQKRLIPTRIYTPYDIQPILSPLAPFVLFEQFHLPLDVSRKIIEYMPWIHEEHRHISEKIASLIDMKRLLINDGFYQENPNRQKKFTVIQDVRLLRTTLNTSPDPLYLNDNQSNIIKIQIAFDRNEMIQACMEQVYALLKQGILPEKIKITHTTTDDMIQLQKWFFLSHIPLETGIQHALTDYPYTLRFLKESKDFGLNETIEKNSNQYAHLSPNDQQLFDQIIQVINDFPSDYFLKNHSYLEFVLRTKNRKRKRLFGAVEIISLENLYLKEDEFLFVLNYEEDSFPTPLRDDDYLTDVEKKAIGFPTSTEKNYLNKRYLIEQLNRCQKLCLFHLRFDGGKEMRLPQFDYSREVQITEYKHQMNKHAKAIALLSYKKYEDRYRKFHISYPQMDLYRSVFREQLSHFDSKFSGLDSSTIEKIIEKNILISPTSLSVFFQCPFQYYIQYLCKIAPFEKSVSLYFGNLTHRLLEVFMKNEDITREAIILEMIEDFPDDIKYKRDLYTQLFLEQFDQMIPYMTRFLEETAFENKVFEESIKYPYELDPRFSIYGKIDRIMGYRNPQGEEYVALIDYKTSTKKFNPKLFQQGIDVQLPFYQHLIKSNNPHARVFGLYIQNLHFGRLPYGNQEKTITDSLRFHGITLDQMDVIKQFGIDYIQGVALKKDETFTKNSKVYSEETFHEYQQIMIQLIDRMIEIIKQGDFQITPKGLLKGEEKVNSCLYCGHQALCYKGAIGSSFGEEEEMEEPYGFNE